MVEITITRRDDETCRILIKSPCNFEKRCVDTVRQELLVAQMSSLIDLATDIASRFVDEHCHDLFDHEGEIIIDDDSITIDHFEAMIELDIAIDL